MLMTYKFVAIIFSCLILVNAIYIGRKQGSFFSLNCLFNLFWFIYTFFPLVCLFTVPINPISIVFIWVCCTLVSISTVFFNWSAAIKLNESKKNVNEQWSSRYSYYIFISLFFFTCFFIIVNIYQQGLSISGYVFNFFEESNKYMALRYSNSIKETISLHLSNIFSYLLVIIGGIIVYFKHRKTLFTCLALFPSAMITLLEAAKGTILLSIILFLGGMIGGSIISNKFELINKKTIKNFVFFILIVSIILVFSFISRGLYDLDFTEALQKMSFYINSYAFGHLYAFSDWFSFFTNTGDHLNEYCNNSHLFYGYYTFTPILKIIGISYNLPPGLYSEYYNYDDIIQSNIYTIFRGNILDFGLSGTIVFWFLVGYLMNFVYYLILIRSNPIALLYIYSMLLGFIYTSFIASLFIWKSVEAAVLFLIILNVFKKTKIKL
ncbi:hypothetical protein FRA_34c06380 [Francisella sp. W12-1067]|nr:hypothetical protein FRA_34c06380 [Francisella sp. W12-1067]